VVFLPFGKDGGILRKCKDGTVNFSLIVVEDCLWHFFNPWTQTHFSIFMDSDMGMIGMGIGAMGRHIELELLGVCLCQNVISESHFWVLDF
jgi:hypothetical protein